jgi:hypothetical protein
MATIKISEKVKNKLLSFLKKNKKTDLISISLQYIAEANDIKPILFPKEKTIYQSLDKLIKKLEEENKLCRETEIIIQLGKQNVNEFTTKIYICPFTGKVYGNNTHPNPQDAIYDWVSKCPENTERIGGLKAKRFFVSEDPQVIKNYIQEQKKPITKTVYSSGVTGKLFNSKKAVIDDFKKNHIKTLTLFEVQNQNKYQIEEHFLNFLQDELSEDKITHFVEALYEFKEFEPYLTKWLEK